MHIEFVATNLQGKRHLEDRGEEGGIVLTHSVGKSIVKIGG